MIALAAFSGLAAGILLAALIVLWGDSKRRCRLNARFAEAIDEAEVGTEASKAYVLGLCSGAAIADVPEATWASPQRHARQQAARR